jgi:ATP-dependent DNA helicase RecQ
MIEYAGASACLRAAILRYFGDNAAHEPCAACGNCRPDAVDAHEREIVRKILAGIARSGERYGRHRVSAMLLGEADDVPPALAALSTFGLLRDETADTLRGWIRSAVSAGLVAVSDNQYRTLSLTDLGRAFMHGRLPDAAIGRPIRRRRWAELRDVRDDRRYALKAQLSASARKFRLR